MPENQQIKVRIKNDERHRSEKTIALVLPKNWETNEILNVTKTLKTVSSDSDSQADGVSEDRKHIVQSKISVR
ncbi:MAG: hypothetical protein OHK0019_07530 [Saprospiraceae bacterium]